MSSATSTTSSEAEQPTFDVIPLSTEVRAAVDELGYKHPTPVQRAVFDSAARGKDLVVQARTGTGKTAAFGLPIVDRLAKARIKAVQAVVLCPTRELALQVTRELTALSKNSGLTILPVYGGVPMTRQVEGLQAGAQVLVGTPGRVLDHLRRGTLDASKVRLLTLDECDEMLSMGFLPQILDIWNQLPQQLQVLLFSATVPRPVLRVAESRLKDPEFITLSGDQVGALEIEHYVYLSQGDKLRELQLILQAEKPESAIIFCNTRDDTQRVATALQKAGYEADWLNADLSQNEREAVMQATREGRLPFLVCTDVAARGIDISHLTHVVNFDFPDSNEQYVHRTGRTGRAGRMGTAISLVSPGAIGNLYYLRLEYKIHPIERQLPSADELRSREEANVVGELVARFNTGDRRSDSILKRLLTHERGEQVLSSLLREHLASLSPNGKRAEGPPSGLRAAEPSRRRGSRKPLPPAPTRAPAEAPVPPAPTPAVAESNGGSVSAGSKPDPGPKASAGRDAPRNPAEDRRDSRAEETAEEEADNLRRTAPRKDRPASRARRVTEGGISYEVRDASTEPAASAANREVRPNAPESDAGARDSSTASAQGREATAVQELFVNVGRDDSLSESELRDALAKAGVDEAATAYVRIRQRHTFVGVQGVRVEQVAEALTGETLAGKEIVAEKARPRSSRRS